MQKFYHVEIVAVLFDRHFPDELFPFFLVLVHELEVGVLVSGFVLGGEWVGVEAELERFSYCFGFE